MDRDTLYFHFANLGLTLIGFLSVQTIVNPFVFIVLVIGTILGFLVSWQMKGSRLQHMDTFIGMLSLASVVIILGRLYDTAITFENLLKIFSTALVWLTFFQSFGLKTGRSYAILQFIAVCLLISSVGLALEKELFYIVLLAIFLFIFIFTMRLGLVCEKKMRGSAIIGDRREIMSLWQQIKVGAVMFSFVLIVASFVYPFVPKFESLSLSWIPSTLFGIPEKVPLLKLFKEAPTIEDKRKKEEQLIDDGTKKRETGGEDIEKRDKETVKRFPARGFDKDIDIFKIESLTIRADKNEVPLDRLCRLEVELKMNDGSIIPATRLVDWKVTGTAEVSIDSSGNLVPKKEGYVEVSASYLGTFSNTAYIKLVKPTKPVKKKSWVYYLSMVLFWLVLLLLSSLMIRIFMKSRRLNELAIGNPREFIREIYIVLCRGFRFYGIRKFDYVAHREFFESVKGLLSSKSEPMFLMTEGVLEARFSTHEISTEHSQRMLGLLHEIKEVVLQREERRDFWRKILFRLFLLDVSMVPRDIKRA